MERIAVIGTGYVGLVAGAIFAANGHRVICADIDKDKIARLEQGQIPIFEPGLQEIVRSASAAGHLSFTTDVLTACRESTVIFIAVGTPTADDGSFDAVYIKAAAQTVGKSLKGQKGERCVVIKSTIVPSLYGEIKEALFAELTEEDLQHLKVDLAVNPEFMAEGTAVRDFSKPGRVIIGTTSEHTKRVLRGIYRDLVKVDTHRIMYMRPESAIVAKLASNGMLATRVAFMNEVARYCDAVNADVEEVRLGMSRDHRIGEHFLYSGPGYGGSCFPKDISALHANATSNDLSLGVIAAVEPSNEDQKTYVVQRVREQLGDLQGLTIAVWGVAFKARTDDVRDSPALAIIQGLLDHSATVKLHDPQGLENAKHIFGDAVTYCSTKEATLPADALLLLTEWDAYKNPDYEELGRSLTKKFVYDARNILDPRQLKAHGVTYHGVGRRHG